MRRTPWPLVVLAVLLAALFVRLGFWQLSRLHERRARNAEISARLAAPPVVYDTLTDTISFRRATVSGTSDYHNEIVYAGRSHDGSPGVYIMTPITGQKSFTPSPGVLATSPAIFVIRGWVYAPDAATVDLRRWRENRESFSGYLSVLPHDPPRTTPTEPRVRTLDRETLQHLTPYLISPMYLVAQDSAGANAPIRLPPPRLDDGPHLSYAIQWFSFAAIALAGAVVVARRTQSKPDLET